ncbi:perlucin-like protein [Saccostrea cucullata]|uniref:perlucin-like protein n=1 Tax=Saccostrea cuccullata TaxID=36930 RepID=UPI002ED4904D
MTSEILQLFCLQFAVYIVWACPAGWIKHGPACYHMGPEVESWFDGMTMCQIHGSNLASVLNQEEHNFIVSLMKQYKKDVVWLGATDWDNEGTFVWEPNGDKMNYQNFGHGEPDDRLNQEDCLLIDGSSNNHHTFVWDDRNCYDRNYYICKQMDDITGNLVG